MQDQSDQNIKTQKEEQINEIVKSNGFNVADVDMSRPWGGFVRLDNGDARAFIAMYFPDLEFETYENLSPKFLLVAPGKRLSWQKHDRRAELWRVLEGPVGVKISEMDKEPDEVQVLATGETIQFAENIRHRLIGLETNWGIVTEIWQHTDPSNPSDESDIIRIQDDFGR